MIKTFKVAAGIILCIILICAAIGLVFFIFDSPYPTQMTSAAWEKNFKETITSEIVDFHGYWLDADIAAYIYGYQFTSGSPKEHKEILISALKEFRIIVNNDKELIMRQSVTYYHPDGYNEWRFLLNTEDRQVTVLYANLDSAAEMAYHEKLVALAEDYHKKRPNKSPS